MKTKITFLILSFFTLTLFSQTTIDYSLAEFWDGTDWQNRFKYEYQYNTNNELIVSTSLIWHYSGSGWVNSSKNIYTYDTNSNIIERKEQDWNEATNQWENTNKQIRTINGNNNPIQFLNYDWSGTQWIVSYKTTISYISSGIINESLNLNWDGSQWVNEGKSTYNYSVNNKFDNIIYQYWDGNYWVTSKKSNYSYYGNGKISHILSQEWTSNQWQDFDRQEYQLDSNFNRLFNINHDLSSGTDPYEKYEYTYDASVLMSTITHPFNDTLLYNLGFEDNPYTNKVLNEIQSSFNNGVWEQENRLTFHYDNTTRIDDFTNNTINIYPNPAINSIKFDTKHQLNNYQIIDINGKTVMQGNLENKQIDVSNLSNGMYFTILTTEHGKAVKRFIKQ